MLKIRKTMKFLLSVSNRASKTMEKRLIQVGGVFRKCFDKMIDWCHSFHWQNIQKDFDLESTREGGKANSDSIMWYD